MADKAYTKQEVAILGDALETYKDEVKKLMKKAEKLGVKEAETLKQTFLEVEALRNKVNGDE